MMVDTKKCLPSQSVEKVQFLLGFFCILNDARGADEKERQEEERKAKISEILYRGNQPRFCICCGEIVGEVLGGDIIGTEWYDNHEVCSKGHVCKNCMRNCGGLKVCRYNEN